MSPGGPVRQPYLTRLDRLAKSIPGLLKCLKIWAHVLLLLGELPASAILAKWALNSPFLRKIGQFVIIRHVIKYSFIRWNAQVVK
jgi:hypothetical protein